MSEMTRMSLWVRLLETAQGCCRVEAGSGGGTTLLHVEVRTPHHRRVLPPTGGFPHLLLEGLGKSSIPQHLDLTGQAHTGGTTILTPPSSCYQQPLTAWTHFA